MNEDRRVGRRRERKGGAREGESSKSTGRRRSGGERGEEGKEREEGRKTTKREIGDER